MLTPDAGRLPLPPDDTVLHDFITELARLVRAEANEATRQIEHLWSQPLLKRVATGRAIDAITIVKVHPDGLVELCCHRNESRFREGDMLCLSRGDPFAEPNFLVTLELDEETDLLVSTDAPGITAFDFVAQPDGWVLDEGYLNVSDYILEALDEAADTAAGRERVLPLLTGQIRPSLDLERFEYALERAEQWGLNAQQADAVASAYASDLAYLVQGPPGTGKTVVLARLAQLFAEDGERVLVTCFTHRAIANALNKLAELASREDATPVTAVKIGHEARADGLQVEHYATFDSSPLCDLSGAYIVGATPFATRTRRLHGVEFETVIVDEASQITLPLAIMAMLVARRTIFVGDHQQLPPVLATRYGDQMLRDSVFGVLVDRGFDTMLEETYRLNDVLAAWPSKAFYAGRLVPAEGIGSRRISYAQPPERFAEILDPAVPKVFVDLGHRNATTRNEQEAQLAVELILTLVACGVAPAEIGVVTPYRAQSRAIRNRLRQALPEHNAERRALVIDTVERMQGQERDVIIVSLTSSDAKFVSEVADFFFQPERLNVTITRPRHKLIILGSRHVLEARPGEATSQHGLELWRDLLASCAHPSIT
ncbi:AAA family ATPase [Candidatus Chloroploca sp. M-50]|uniref:AAA family ATPase n=1 Tax=Candidatus Chloroploca mongolica TaxID=2528176 RepID=A0ABS4DEX0_9CHLR|nr:AAA domain-containing protein [Candidatus Chloroploca mongolica]MBP1467980.1 AAA family ATPase [Candidatus Chloroploca mongolica]